MKEQLQGSVILHGKPTGEQLIRLLFGISPKKFIEQVLEEESRAANADKEIHCGVSG